MRVIRVNRRYWSSRLLARDGNNLRQLGIATRLYSEDNNSQLPSAEILPTEPIDPQKPLPRICDVLATYIGTGAGTNTNTNQATVFKCPTDKLGLFAAEGSSYEWNADLNGHRIDEISQGKFRSNDDLASGLKSGKGIARLNNELRHSPRMRPLRPAV